MEKASFGGRGERVILHARTARAQRTARGANGATASEDMINSPAAAAKQRVRLPRGIDVLVATDRMPGVDEAIEETRRNRLSRNKQGEEDAQRLRRDERSEVAKSVAPRKRAASPKEVTCEEAAKPSSTSSTVPVKRQQRLLEKVSGGRPTSEVVKSTPVGVAAINNAPKISDFKEGTTEERIRAHAAAMVKWSTPNLTRRAIEKETRVRRRRIELGKSYMLQLYAMLAYTGQVLGLRGPLQRLGGTLGAGAPGGARASARSAATR